MISDADLLAQHELPQRAIRETYLFIYAPTTLDDYIKRLGGKDSWVIRRPMRP